MTLVHFERPDSDAVEVLYDESARRVDSEQATDMRTSEPGIARVINEALLLVIVGIVGFAGYFTIGSDRIHEREQRTLRREFRAAAAAVALDPQFALDGSGNIVGVREVAPGAPVAELEIPSIGVDQIVVEGTRPDDTMRGPGHLPASPLPGQYGNVVIIGRRSSFGAPLRDLDRLAVGEVIRVRGGLGTFTYVVRDAVLAAANDATVFATRARRNTLTLMTAGSDWSAQQRFVVIAELRGRPQGFSPSTIAPRPAELGLVGDRRGWVPFVFALQLLLTVSVALVWLRRHWLAGCTWVVGVPTIGAACWMVFDQAARLLPSSL